MGITVHRDRAVDLGWATPKQFNEIWAWCREQWGQEACNLTHLMTQSDDEYKWLIDWNHVVFSHPKHAVLFKLRWYHIDQ